MNIIIPNTQTFNMIAIPSVLAGAFFLFIFLNKYLQKYRSYGTVLALFIAGVFGIVAYYINLISNLFN